MNIIKRCKHGLMLFNRNDVWQGRSFEIMGEYSEGEVSLFEKILKKGDLVVEVGANMGSHTMPLSKIVGSEGSVIAVEPERHCFYILCANVAINNLRNVFPFQQAFGDKLGSIVVPELAQEGSLNVGGTELEQDWSEVPHYPVGLNSIDNLSLQRLDFLKVDVEGMEEKVLRGGEKTIRQYWPIIYVESDRPEKDESLRAFICSLGYEIYTHNPPFWNAANFFEAQNNVFGEVVSLNLLCLPKARKTEINPEELGLQRSPTKAIEISMPKEDFNEEV
jgi:FkbM family methyltransferase